MLASYLEPSFQTNLASRSQPHPGVYAYTIPIHTQVRRLHLGVKSPIQNPNPVEELEQRARPTTLDLTGHKRPREIQCYAKFPKKIQFLLAKTNVHFPKQKKMTEIIRSFFGGPQQLSCPVKPKKQAIIFGHFGHLSAHFSLPKIFTDFKNLTLRTLSQMT